MELVRKYLADSGCSVKRLAELAKVQQSTLHRAVAGERRLSGDSAIKLSQIIGVSPLDLRPDLIIADSAES